MSIACAGFGLAFGAIIGSFYSPDPDDVLAGGRKWGLFVLGVGVLALVTGAGQGAISNLPHNRLMVIACVPYYFISDAVPDCTLACWACTWAAMLSSRLLAVT